MPTQNCLAHGAIQASAKADNHITAVTLILEHLWNTKFSCLLVADLFWTQERRKPSSWTPSRFFFAQPLQEKPCQVMFVGTQQTREQQELNTREREGQDATKISFALAESCIPFLLSIMPISMTWSRYYASSSKTTLIPWPVSSKHHLHPKQLSSHDKFHPKTFLSKTNFIPKRFWCENNSKQDDGVWPKQYCPCLTPSHKHGHARLSAGDAPHEGLLKVEKTGI